MLKIKCDIGRSKIFLSVLIVLYVAALLAVLIAMVPWLYKVCIILFLIVCFVIRVNNQVLLNSKRSIKHIENNPDGSWILYNGVGEHWQGILQGDSFRSNFVVILNFKVPGRYLVWPVVIFYDALSADIFRQLRVALWMVRKTKQLNHAKR